MSLSPFFNFTYRALDPAHDHHLALPEHDDRQERVGGLAQRLRDAVALVGLHGARPQQQVVLREEVREALRAQRLAAERGGVLGTERNGTDKRCTWRIAYLYLLASKLFEEGQGRNRVKCFFSVYGEEEHTA